MFVIAVFCVVTSCEKDLLEESSDTSQIENNELETRSANISNYDPLEYLDGIHINVVLNSNGSKKFLSTSRKKNIVDLYDKDDGSGRQKWYFVNAPNKRMLRIVGGAYNSNGILSTNGLLGGPITPICIDPTITNVHIEKAPNTLHGYYITYGFGSGSNIRLSSKKYGEGGLEFQDKSKTGGRDVWAFIPVDKYELIDIRYFQTYSDIINSRPELVENVYLTNKNNPNEMKYTKNISESVTESSAFSEMEGLKMTNKITNSASVGVGLPIVNFGAELSIETSNEKSWTYTTSGTTTKTRTITDIIETKVPAYSDMVVKVYIAKCDLNISYEAKLKNTTTGRLLTLYGKWAGSVAGRDIYIEPILYGPKSTSEMVKIDGKKHISEFPRK